jgi:hypothetical protein
VRLFITTDYEDLLKVINKKLEHHTCNEQWGCYKCYHSQVCTDYEILLLAKKEAEQH